MGHWFLPRGLSLFQFCDPRSVVMIDRLSVLAPTDSNLASMKAASGRDADAMSALSIDYI